MPNPTDVTAKINGLIPNHKYAYEFDAHSNWPITISPISGFFYAIDDSQAITASVYFCPNKTTCADNPGFVDCDDNSCGIGTSKFAVLGLSYYDVNNSSIKYSSNFVKVEYSGYYPPQLTLNIDSSGVSDQSINTFKEYEKVELSASMHNLIPNETYYYQFRNLDNNYSSSVIPESGYFTAYGDTQNIYAAVYLTDPDVSSSSSKIGDSYFARIDCTVRADNETSLYTSNSVRINFLSINPSVDLAVSETQIASNEYKDIVAHISGIIPNEEYGYRFNSVGSNWPTTVTEKSGTFISRTDEFDLRSTLYFCPNLTACTGHSNLLNWEDTLSGYDNTLFTNVNLIIYPLDNAKNTSYSNILSFDYSPKIPIGQISVGPTGNPRQEQTINLNFSNLKPNKLYNYSVYSIESNWPFAMANTSGSFYAESTDYKIEIVSSFCENSGICPKNSYGVLDFEAMTPMKLSWYKPQVSMRMSFQDSEFPSLVYKSNVAQIVCDGCMPTNKSVNIVLNSIPDC